MPNIKIGKSIQLNNGIMVVGNRVTINGEKMPPCPTEGNKSTIIDGKVYIDGYELINGQWKRTIKALWHKLF